MYQHMSGLSLLRRLSRCPPLTRKHACIFGPRKPRDPVVDDESIRVGKSGGIGAEGDVVSAFLRHAATLASSRFRTRIVFVAKIRALAAA